LKDRFTGRLVLAFAAAAWGWSAAGADEEGTAGGDRQVFPLERMEGIGRNLWHAGGFVQVPEATETAETPFTKSVADGEGRMAYVRLPMLPASDQVALRYVDNALHTVYIDLNGDGAVQEDEALKPELAGMVVTPEFTVKDGEEAPPRHIRLRLMAVGNRLIVSSASAWKGSGTLNGEPLTLVIGDAAFSGTPDSFGTDQLMIFAEAAAQGYVRPQVLGRTVLHAGAFYEIDLSEAEGVWQAAFRPLRETGTLQVLAPSGAALRGMIVHGAIQQAVDGGAT